VVYNENGSQITVNGIKSPDVLIKPVPSATSAMTVFNYSLASVEDKNGCYATSLAGTRKATVYRVPVANAGPDTEVCGPDTKLAAIPGDGIGNMVFSASGSSINAISLQYCN
jgi:hypothetical protein